MCVCVKEKEEEFVRKISVNKNRYNKGTKIIKKSHQNLT